jgi:hypothetical protein
MPLPSQLKNDEIPVLGILRDASRRGLSKTSRTSNLPSRTWGIFRYLITVEVQGQLHTYVHECGSKDRIDPGLRGQWVWLWVTPMSKITRYSVDGH